VAIRDVDHHLVTRQMCRKGAMIAVGPSVAALTLRVPRQVRRVLPGLVLGVQFALLMQQRPQHLPQQGGVVRQGVRVDLHNIIMNDVVAPGPEFVAPNAAFLSGEFRPAAHATRSRQAKLPVAEKPARSARSSPLRMSVLFRTRDPKFAKTVLTVREESGIKWVHAPGPRTF
jgi:hypothetical protein